MKGNTLLYKTASTMKAGSDILLSRMPKAFNALCVDVETEPKACVVKRNNASSDARGIKTTPTRSSHGVTNAENMKQRIKGLENRGKLSSQCVEQ